MYDFVRIFIKWCNTTFFREIRVEGEPIVENGPLLVVSNHPNMMIDSLLIAALYKRHLWFLAKSTLFTNPFISSILRVLHLLPIYRKSDGLDTSQNEKTFSEVSKILREGKGVLIFPEGRSIGQSYLLPVKTGAARLALQAEKEADFKLGLKIQSIGVNYSAPVEFQSDVTLKVAEPILVSNYSYSTESEFKERIKSLTEAIEDKIRNMTVQVEDSRLRIITEKVAKLFDNGTTFDIFDLIAKNVSSLAPHYPEKIRELEKRIDEILEEPLVLKSNDEKTTKLLFLVQSYAALLHYIPYKVVGSIARRISLFPETAASNKLVLGIFLFPLWYFILTIIFIKITHSIIFSSLLTVVTLLSGVYLSRSMDKWRTSLLSLLMPNRVHALRVKKELLIEDLRALQVHKLEI